jgi:hypothetical protein
MLHAVDGATSGREHLAMHCLWSLWEIKRGGIAQIQVGELKHLPALAGGIELYSVENSNMQQRLEVGFSSSACSLAQPLPWDCDRVLEPRVGCGFFYQM